VLFNNFFSKNRSVLFVLIISGVLHSCSSTPQQQLPVITELPDTDELPAVIVEDASFQLEQAKQLIESNPEQANTLMVKAAELYLEQEAYNNALWLANQLLDESLNLPPHLQYRLLITKVYAIKNIDETADIAPLLAEIEQLAESKNINHGIMYFQLRAEEYLQKQNLVLLIDAQLRIFALNPTSSEEDVLSLWQGFVELTQWQQQQLDALNAPMLSPWLALTKLANVHGHNPGKMLDLLASWQEQNPTHPANVIVDSMLNQANDEQLALAQVASEQQMNNVVVLLPLSGKQAIAGQAAQQGLLAAYQNKTDINLHFIDTDTLDFATLPEQLAQLSASSVIGPLLKRNVEQFLDLSIELPSLLLNIPSDRELTTYQIALSMRPEDEAIQAAAQLSDNNYKKPLILSHNDAVSQRIANAFASHWYQLTGNPIESMVYSEGKAMQDQLKQSLAVDASQKRIADLRSRLKQVIKIESRNRRDIDMIYVVGTNGQTRLIKPYIDVNTATFSNIIPVYASSRSHSLNHDDSALVDLNGIKFTEMPWLLDSEQQDTSLTQQAKALWPNRSDSLHRIFAMGYDAIALNEKFIALQNKPYLRHFGQTGVLKLDSNNVLTRSLLWGQYSRKKVKQIAAVN